MDRIPRRSPTFRTRRVFCLALAGCVGLLLPQIAVASTWTVVLAGSSKGESLATRVNAPTGVTVPSTDTTSTVAVSWTASAVTGGAKAPSGYYVTRTNTSTLVVSAACGTNSTTLTASTNCSDTSVPVGTYTYAVVASLQKWTATSSSSGILTESNPPTPALVQAGPLATGAGTSFTATLSSATSSGDLLTAVIADQNSGCATDNFTAPSGWVRAVSICRGSNGPLEIWYKANSASGATSFAFNTGSSGANIEAQVSEWRNVATSSPLDQTGTIFNASSGGTLTVSTSGVITSSNELAVTGFLTSSGLSSFGAGTGWTASLANPGGGFDTSYLIGPTSGSTVTQSATSSPQTNWAGGIATFLP